MFRYRKNNDTSKNYMANIYFDAPEYTFKFSVSKNWKVRNQPIVILRSSF